MKGIFALIVLVIIVGGGWYFYQNSSPSVPAVPTTTTDVMNTTESTTMETGTIPSTETSPTTQTAPAEAKVLNLTGKMFAFSQTEIRVKKGETVTVNFESTEGLHDWVVDEFNARTKQVQPGTKTSVTFVADKTGTFEYYCSVGKHRQMGMVGKLIVE